jgi:hypothetical protein
MATDFFEAWVLAVTAFAVVSIGVGLTTKEQRARLWCALRLHTWGRWRYVSDVERVDTRSNKPYRFGTVQQRACEHCGKIDRRIEWLDE